jgi:hypothetical protein
MKYNSRQADTKQHSSKQQAGRQIQNSKQQAAGSHWLTEGLQLRCRVVKPQTNAVSMTDGANAHTALSSHLSTHLPLETCVDGGLG